MILTFEIKATASVRINFARQIFDNDKKFAKCKQLTFV